MTDSMLDQGDCQTHHLSDTSSEQNSTKNSIPSDFDDDNSEYLTEEIKYKAMTLLVESLHKIATDVKKNQLKVDNLLFGNHKLVTDKVIKRWSTTEEDRNKNLILKLDDLYQETRPKVIDLYSLLEGDNLDVSVTDLINKYPDGLEEMIREIADKKAEEKISKLMKSQEISRKNEIETRKMEIDKYFEAKKKECDDYYKKKLNNFNEIIAKKEEVIKREKEEEDKILVGAKRKREESIDKKFKELDAKCKKIDEYDPKKMKQIEQICGDVQKKISISLDILEKSPGTPGKFTTKTETFEVAGNTGHDLNRILLCINKNFQTYIEQLEINNKKYHNKINAGIQKLANVCKTTHDAQIHTENTTEKLLQYFLKLNQANVPVNNVPANRPIVTPSLPISHIQGPSSHNLQHYHYGSVPQIRPVASLNNNTFIANNNLQYQNQQQNISPMMTISPNQEPKTYDPFAKVKDLNMNVSCNNETIEIDDNTDENILNVDFGSKRKS